MRPYYTHAQLIALASLVALDFAFGMVAKALLAPTGILQIVRVDMIFPVALMMFARLLLDRLGTLTLYEGAWGVLSMLLMPTAFGLPGPLKLLPALAQGLAYDAVFSGIRRWPRGRVLAAAVLGGLAGMGMMVALKLLLGMPWSGVTQILFGVQAVTGVAVSLGGAWLGWLAWSRIRHLQLARRFQACIP